MSKLNVNGHVHTVDVRLGAPSLWALRDTLGMAGTKLGCAIAMCGASTVGADWGKHHVAQRCHCRSGRAMNTAASLKFSPKGLQPTPPEIDVAKAGNISHCGPCARIRAASPMTDIAVQTVAGADVSTGMQGPGLPPLAPAFANAIARVMGTPQGQLPFELT